MRIGAELARKMTALVLKKKRGLGGSPVMLKRKNKVLSFLPFDKRSLSDSRMTMR